MKDDNYSVEILNKTKTEEGYSDYEMVLTDHITGNRYPFRLFKFKEKYSCQTWWMSECSPAHSILVTRVYKKEFKGPCLDTTVAFLKDRAERDASSKPTGETATEVTSTGDDRRAVRSLSEFLKTIKEG